MLKKEDKRGITIYLFSEDRKRKLSLSSEKVRFFKYSLIIFLLVFVSSVGLNFFFADRYNKYLSLKREVEESKVFMRRTTFSLLKDKKLLDLSAEKLWRLSLSKDHKPWEGGNFTGWYDSNVINSAEESLEQIGESVKNLEKVGNDLYRVFLSPYSPYQWIPNYMPVTGEVAIPFGEYKDPFTQKVEQHNGIGIVTPFGSKVRAAAAGKIIYIGRSARFGRVVKISHGYGLETIYGHIDLVKYPVGYSVKKGEVFAVTGNVGRLIEPLLYFEVDFEGRPCDPESFLLQR